MKALVLLVLLLAQLIYVLLKLRLLLGKQLGADLMLRAQGRLRNAALDFLIQPVLVLGHPALEALGKRKTGFIRPTHARPPSRP